MLSVILFLLVMPVMGLAQEPLFRVGDFKTRSLAEAKKSSGFTCSKFYYDKDGIFTTCFKTFDTYDSESESCQSDTLLRCCFAVPSSIEKITEATKNIVQTSLKNGREIVDLINAANKTLEKCVPKQSFHLEMGAVVSIFENKVLWHYKKTNFCRELRKKERNVKINIMMAKKLIGVPKRCFSILKLVLVILHIAHVVLILHKLQKPQQDKVNFQLLKCFLKKYLILDYKQFSII
jgi:hypothetical protein